MKITIIDPTICQVDDPKTLSTFLCVDKSFWKKGAYGGMKRSTYSHSLVDHKGFFLSGFIPRIQKECAFRNIPLKIEGQFERLKFDRSLKYPSITLFDDQKELVIKGLEAQRGIIESPTGTGKTVIAYALIYPFMPCRACIVCTSQSIMYQIAEQFNVKFGLKTSIFGDGKQDLNGNVVVGMINSLANIPPETHCDLFDVLIFDEAHHIGLGQMKNRVYVPSMYEKFLRGSLAPVRIGLTATTQKPNSEKAMAAEGLIGPIIESFSFQEAVEKKRIVMPKLILLSIPQNHNITDLRAYQDIYWMGIVNNRIRNGIIVDFVRSEIANQNKISITFVRLIEHAEILYEMMRKKGIECEIVNGDIKGREREIAKQQLIERKISTVIATSAWKEGLDIPTLDAVINAAGYKDSIPIKQQTGRSTRRVEGEKEEAILVDTLDIGKYLSVHCVHRLQTYKELGML